MVIGLTGRNGSGKGVVADALKKKGFAYVSLSDVLREEIRKAGKEVTRENLIQMGRSLRQEGGPGVLAERVLPKIKEAKNIIVDSIRHPDEVKILKQKVGLKLICIQADQKVRFERCKQRGRENDPVEFNEFVRLENEELKNKTQAAQQLIDTEKLADFVLENNGTIQDVEVSIDGILEKVK